LQLCFSRLQNIVFPLLSKIFFTIDIEKKRIKKQITQNDLHLEAMEYNSTKNRNERD